MIEMATVFALSNGDITLTFYKKVLQFLCHQKYFYFKLLHSIHGVLLIF